MGCILKQGGGLYARMRVGAVLLAAGQGSRMGNRPKALLQLQGVPLINRHLIALSGAGVDEVVVVTGFYHEQIEPLVQSFPVQIIRNEDPAAGQAGSVRLGVEALGERFDAVIMMLCDQPLISATDITALIAAFKKRPYGEIVMPEVNGLRGNPIVLSGKAISDILAAGQNMYCRKYMDAHPELISHYKTDNAHFVTDVDTERDLAAFENRWGFSLTWPDSQPQTDETTVSQGQGVPEPAYLALRKQFTAST
jgi:CTP:molybdopterin cytidylyltransferase MocA